MNLSKSLRVAIANEGIKHKDLAVKLGVSSQQVSNWLRTGAIKQTNIIDLCIAFNMPVSKFVALGED